MNSQTELENSLRETEGNSPSENGISEGLPLLKESKPKRKQKRAPKRASVMIFEKEETDA